MIATGCGYRTLGARGVPVTLESVVAVDPDPALVAIARATVIEAFARAGLSEGGATRVAVTLRSPPSATVGLGFVSEVRVEVSLRARVSEGDAVRWVETEGEGEAAVGQSAMSAAEALTLARRRACERAAAMLAEALRGARD